MTSAKFLYLILRLVIWFTDSFNVLSATNLSFDSRQLSTRLDAWIPNRPIASQLDTNRPPKAIESVSNRPLVGLHGDFRSHVHTARCRLVLVTWLWSAYQLAPFWHGRSVKHPRLLDPTDPLTHPQNHTRKHTNIYTHTHISKPLFPIFDWRDKWGRYGSVVSQ